MITTCKDCKREVLQLPYETGTQPPRMVSLVKTLYNRVPGHDTLKRIPGTCYVDHLEICPGRRWPAPAKQPRTRAHA